MNEKKSFSKSTNLPLLKTLKSETPLNQEDIDFIEKQRNEITDILKGKSDTFLLIIGPCSIHNIEGIKEYAEKLKKLSTAISVKFKIVMRAHLEKPRTISGWKGFIIDPLLNNSYDIDSGIRQSRELLLYLTKKRIPLATEFLDPMICPFIEEFISLGAIGARTVESPLQRQMASSLDIPMIFKNSTNGSVDIAINGILAAREPQHSLTIDEDNRLTIQHTKGNKNSFLALRGSWNNSNYNEETIQYSVKKLSLKKLCNNILVDCAHGNCSKSTKTQALILKDILSNHSPHIKGLMVESYLEEGSSGESTPSPSKSITDPCLGWDTTEKIILEAYLQN